MVPTKPDNDSSSPPTQFEPSSLETRWGLRKIVVEETETFTDGQMLLPVSLVHVTVSAVLNNPWIGQGTNADLISDPRAIAARMAKLLGDRLLMTVGGSDRVEAFGKGAIIGLDGELEHGAALTHTPYFASSLRTFLNGSAVISFADVRGEAGEALTLPLCEKTTGVSRDHYQTVRVRLPDSPRADEIVLAAAVATGPRPFARVGDRSTDQPLDTHIMTGAFA